jgi:diacylglycerol kinase family enzyme
VPNTSHHIVLNSNSGAARATGLEPQSLVERFVELGHQVSIDADSRRTFDERLHTARLSPAPVLVAAGGDGTATALAQVAVETGKMLLVLPLGTANLLGRDLGLPQTVDEWFRQLPAMGPRQIDVGEVNGQVFLHKVVVGAVPGIALVREQIRGNDTVSAKLAFISHAIRRLSRLRPFSVEIASGSADPHIERVQSIAVANNDYDEGPGKFFFRSRLDAGTLSLYLIRHLSFVDALRLAARMLVGAWKSDEVVEVENVCSLVMRTSRRRVRAMIDGEVGFLPTPLHFRIRPLALTVLAPPVASADQATTVSAGA